MSLSYEIRPKGKEVLKNARNIKQKNSKYSRLYTTPKEYDLLRWRTRVDNKLKPIGTKHYNVPDESPSGIIDKVINIHGKEEFYVACSGGKDSISLAHYVSTNYPKNFKGLVFIDTGVGIKKTKEWLIDYAKEKGWELYIIKSKIKDAYENLVKKYGFPGAGFHNIVMRILKYVVLREFAFEPIRKEKCIIISGTRKFESARRNINTKAITRDGSFYFCSPFYAKTDEFVYKYLLENGLKKTPIHDILGMSGECMCGCYAGVGERELIKQLDPELDQFLTDLERAVQIEGTDAAKKHPTWGGTNNKPPVIESGVDSDVEAIICGSECGGGTMRGTENF